MITCQGCGTKNSDDAAFCSKCARKLDPVTQQAVIERRAAHTATGIRWTSVLISILLILVIALVVALLVTGVI